MTNKKLTELTEVQQQILVEKRDEWLSVGLNTAPADRSATEAAVRRAYETAGLPAPRFFIWVNNPLHGAYAQALLRSEQFQKYFLPDQVGDQVGAQVGDQVRAQVRDQVRDQVGDQVRDQVGDQVRAQVWAQVGDQVRDQVGDQVWDQVGDQVGDQVWAQVGDQVRAQVGDQVWDQVRDQVGDQVWDQVRAQVGAQVRDQVRDQVGDQVRAQVWDWNSNCCWGQHDYWLSFYDTFDTLGIKNTQAIRGIVGVARNAGWWWPLRGAVVLSERPNRLMRDANGRLHCEDGPALSYPGGAFDMYMWHGTRVPADLIETPWGVEKIMAERNAEIRRCAIEKMGWDQFVLASEFKLVDECPDPGNTGQVLRLYDIPRKVLDLPVRALVCTNATVERGGQRHTFGITTPTDCKTALQAAAWTFDLTEGEYRELARAT